MTDAAKIAVGLLMVALFSPVGWIGLLLSAILLHGLAVAIRAAFTAC